MLLEWVRSYETIKWNTPDGDLHKGQVGVSNGLHYVRRHPENNYQFVCLESDDSIKDIAKEIEGLAVVESIAGEHMYYDIFKLPSGRQFRTPSNRKLYKDLAKPNAGKREKQVTQKEIADIVKDDNSWL